MQPDPETEARRWLEQSLRDLDDARFAHGGDRYNLACFVAQQAAEKALKAYLILRGVRGEQLWGHSVAVLCRKVTELDPSFESLEATASGLDLYYIPTRYPNALPGGLPAEAFDAAESQRALERAEKVIEKVRVVFEGEGS